MVSFQYWEGCCKFLKCTLKGQAICFSSKLASKKASTTEHVVDISTSALGILDLKVFEQPSSTSNGDLKKKPLLQKKKDF